MSISSSSSDSWSASTRSSEAAKRFAKRFEIHRPKEESETKPKQENKKTLAFPTYVYIYIYDIYTLPETNMAPKNRPSQKETIQPSIFRCELLVSGRVFIKKHICFCKNMHVHTPSQSFEWSQTLNMLCRHQPVPKHSMYGIFTLPNTTKNAKCKYTIHWASGVRKTYVILN